MTNIIPRITKTYFCTSQKNNRFPSEFIQSKNPRYIIVQQCKAKYNGFLVADIEMHASFIERDHYEDYFCIFTNENRTKYKKYSYMSSRQDFELWFTDMQNNIIEPDSFLLELLLIY